jgi:tripeptide aminopeptidase
MAESTATATSVLERFLRYVQIDTQSDPASSTVPSTRKQLVLLDLLVQEMRALGIADAERSEHGVVMGTIPATTRKTGVPVIGFLAHVDTSPEMSGENVAPIVHHAWSGADIVLPRPPQPVLSATDDPALRARIGHDIVTASGDTLLGADDKSGVAEVMAAAEYLLAHPEIPHGAIRLGFTPDEEIGHGATHFDVARFGAFCAYTLDGEGVGGIDTETFSADAMNVTFRGRNTHPGYAKGSMVNAVKVAADFVSRLPRDRESPETTDAMQGFVHPNDIVATVDETTVHFIVRDYSEQGLHAKEAWLESLANETAKAWPGASVTCTISETYRNMKEVLDRHPEIVEHAREAVRRAGIEPRHTAIRGGTDGSRLSYMGLPTPNLFAGQHRFHSRYEWVSAQDMEKAVQAIVQLCRVWEEKS